MPALRDRADDLPLLLDQLLERLGVEASAEAAELRAPAMIDVLRRHRWPGNVRELRNYVERYLTLREPPQFAAPILDDPARLIDAGQTLRAVRGKLRALETQYVIALLERHGGNAAAAARAAGVHRSYLFRLLQRAGVR
jgi:DNA-binding NtrC family response regulator